YLSSFPGCPGTMLPKSPCSLSPPKTSDIISCKISQYTDFKARLLKGLKNFSDIRQLFSVLPDRFRNSGMRY
ncbi:MAG: hypothetical protein K2O40_02110, partial [Lachnospiraceae bacterium]|nr:hypothetical protein [Lachnospiraceae bacterium]